MAWKIKALAIVLIAGAIGGSINRQLHPAEASKGPAFTPWIVEASVKEKLRDPDSAVFGKMYPVAGGVCGDVNAKNGFGGYSGKTTFIYMNAGGQVFLDPHVNNAGFVKLWHQVCDQKPA